MTNFSRLFIVVEGLNDAYPNYQSAKVNIIKEDPASFSFDNLFICSPIFPLAESGLAKIPSLEKGSKITFLMVPSIIPAFFELEQNFNSSGSLFFSLGLANFLIIEQKDDVGLADSVIGYLKSVNNITASESWVIDEDQRVVKSDSIQYQLYHNQNSVEHCGLTLSDKLPLHLRFAVSEYIMSVDKLLTASKKFTPHYFFKHKQTIEIANLLVSDLCFLHKDFTFEPTPPLVFSLGCKTVEEAKTLITNGILPAKVEELINEKHGMMIQFNSSLSYIYSQAYSGTFPIFDHLGIVRRHSLLGLGTAIASLFELLIQLESAFLKLPFETLRETAYHSDIVPQSFLKHIIDPSSFNSDIWKEDKVRNQIIGLEINKDADVDDDVYNRLSFFSGRLGFREYEFSATAAIQVVVEAHTLPWHIINYTHEVIHNHVRVLLNQLLLIPRSNRSDFSFEEWILKYTNFIKQILKGSKKTNYSIDLTYTDYFITVLLKFIVNGNYYGSLSHPSNYQVITEIQSSLENKTKYLLPNENKIKDLVKLYYKDITEIFVHTIDFCYIYKQQPKIYLTSIWTSWSTIPAVINDLKQYIVRSLVIMGLSIPGIVNNRFSQTLLQFRSLINDLHSSQKKSVFKSILTVLDTESERNDLRFRFYNCIIVGDLAYNFFVGRLENFLDNNDKNNLPTDSKDDEGNPVSYYLKTNSFEGQPIKSKVRFLLDQLGREVFRSDLELEDDSVERTSAWLLLLLSSNEEQ